MTDDNLESFDPNWDPSTFDWSGKSSAGSGPEDVDDHDHDEDAVHCHHPWQHLDFLDLEETEDESLTGSIGCSSCGRVWEPANPDALATVWNAAKMAIVAAHERLDGLEDVLTDRLGVRPCIVCGTWAERASLVDLGEVGACARHVGSALGDEIDPAALLRALEWVRQAGLVGAADMTRVALWEKIGRDCPRLVAAVDEDEAVALARPVDLGLFADALGLPFGVTMRSAALAVAARGDIDPPTSRLSCGYVLGLMDIARRLRDGQIGGNAEAIDEAIDEAIEDNLPYGGFGRMAVAIELCFASAPDDVEFSGDMAEEALRLSSRRIVDLLADRSTRL